MMMISLIISMLLTAFVLVLSIVVISKGYGYKHKIDKIDSADPHQTEDQTSKERDE
ncbi:MAG TPA: YtzI protein [Bacillota bacterium]|nr:YtzI protein [Bacillota bacterium]